MNQLCVHQIVLAKAGCNMLAVKGRNWSNYAHEFLKYCVCSGNIEASYILGMIQFYCLEKGDSGELLLRNAANKCHRRALYAMAVIQFNGSGGSKDTKQDLKGGVSDSEHAAKLGNIDALREIGHCCYQDGYGVRQNIAHGRRLLVEANFHELRCSPLRHNCRDADYFGDFGCDMAEPDVHPANQFLIDWFRLGLGKVEPGLILCSYDRCGRRETRPHEFRRCSVCVLVNYCSRGCQALHWKLGHRVECVPLGHWDELVANVGGHMIQNLMPSILSCVLTEEVVGRLCVPTLLVIGKSDRVTRYRFSGLLIEKLTSSPTEVIDIITSSTYPWLRTFSHNHTFRI